jgi:quinol monooxygenase YgiN
MERLSAAPCEGAEACGLEDPCVREVGFVTFAARVRPLRDCTTCNLSKLLHHGAMYGLIGKLQALAGQRDVLIAILLEGIESMPGCLSYVVARDPADAHGIWITEVWESEANHKASLSLPSVKAAIARGKPLIVAFEQLVETVPVGGHGIRPEA